MISVRPIQALIGAAALAGALCIAAPASAGSLKIEPIGFSPALQTKLERTLGEREGVHLQRMVARALDRALEDTPSGAPVRIEVTIVDAQANRPTFRQLADNVSLDYSGSFGIGGAALTAILRDADGREIGQIAHRYYGHDIELAAYGPDWADAQRAIDQFARKVARAYREAAI